MLAFSFMMVMQVLNTVFKTVHNRISLHCFGVLEGCRLVPNMAAVAR